MNAHVDALIRFSGRGSEINFKILVVDLFFFFFLFRSSNNLSTRNVCVCMRMFIRSGAEII